MTEQRNGNGSWASIAKAILNSQVGGWVLACLAFGFMTWWSIQDRKTVYLEIAKLRENAMAVIIETNKIAALIKDAGMENNRMTEENNAILKDIQLQVRRDRNGEP